MLLFIFVPNLTTIYIITEMCNASRFSGLKLLAFLVHSTEYLDNTIKGFHLYDVGRLTYMILISGWLYKSRIQIIAHQ